MKRLKALRLGLGLTVEEAAARLEVTSAALYSWERTGRVPRDPAAVKRIADFYGVPLTDIWPLEELAA